VIPEGPVALSDGSVLVVEMAARRPNRARAEGRTEVVAELGGSHILALMEEGDDAFNRQDAAAMDTAHHPDMVAQVMGSAEPICGRDAHTAGHGRDVPSVPDIHVDNDSYPIQFGQGDWMTVITKVTGTFSGELALPDGTVIPGTGKSFEVNSPPRRGGRAICSSRSMCSGTQRSWPSRSGLHSVQSAGMTRQPRIRRPHSSTRSVTTPTTSDRSPRDSATSATPRPTPIAPTGPSSIRDRSRFRLLLNSIARFGRPGRVVPCQEHALGSKPPTPPARARPALPVLANGRGLAETAPSATMQVS
jgi:hypothetical protein